jgi:transposase
MAIIVNTWQFHNQDLNAAVNIRNYGMTMIQQTAGTAGIAC